MMLAPQDVEELMGNQGLKADQIEHLRDYYNSNLKDRNLVTILKHAEQSQIETLLTPK